MPGSPQNSLVRPILENLLEHVPGVVFQYQYWPETGKSCFPYASEGMREIYRISPEDVRLDASSVFRRIHPDDLGSFRQSIVESARDLSPWKQEYRVQFEDGTGEWLEGRATPQAMEDGSVLWHGFITRVTERRRVELALDYQRAQLAAFVEHAPAAIAMLDKELRYIAASRQWLKDYGLEGREILGQTHYEIFPNIPQRWKDIHQRCLEGAVEHADCDVWTPQGSHTPQYLRWEVRPWHTAGNEIGGIIMLTQDITASQKVERELIEAKELAEAANQAKSAFLATMSHEIRTPLNGVLGFAQLLETTRLSEEQSDYVRTIISSGENLLALINTILDFSKIEAGKVELDSIPYALEPMIEQVFETIAPQARAKDLALGWYVSPRIPASLSGDPTRIRQVLLNLLGNAVKFTPMGEVAMQVDTDIGPLGQPWIHFQIRDTGVGISDEQQKRLFRPFSQGDASTTRKFGGTGLGLAISRRLAGLMGGKVWIESEPGKGSVFHFTILAREAPDAVPASPLPMLEKLHLLAVDPLPESRLMLSRMASSCGCHAGVFGGWGEAADAGWQAKPCDVALVDVRLARDIPENWLKSEPHKTSPMLILIGHGSQDWADRAALTLERPLSASNLAGILQQLTSEKPQKSAVTPAPKPTLSTEAARLHVLVAEDNPVNQKLASTCLRQLGLRHSMAPNGKEALELCVHGHYDVVLMDCQMPVLDGLEAAREIRAWEKASGRRPMPIIAVTAGAFPEDREKARKAGMNYFLTKPFLIKDLAEVLELAAHSGPG
jgi:PAS domain S-box-containing protein